MNTTTGQTHIIDATGAMEIMCDFLTFRLDEREFAIPLDKVCELRRIGEVAPSRKVSGDIIGTLARHDGDIEVVDLHAILNLPLMHTRTGFDIVVIHAPDRMVGLAVDDVVDAVTLAVDEFMLVTSPAAERNPIWAITMHDERVLRLLDPECFTVETQPGRIEFPELLHLERLAA